MLNAKAIKSLLAFLAFPMCQAAVAAESGYVFVPLTGQQADQFAELHAVNERGTVVGAINTQAGASYTAIWRGSTVVMGGKGIATGINNAGSASGYLLRRNGDTVPVRWNQGSGIVALETDGTKGGFAAAINDVGQVAGSQWTTDNVTQHATVWNGTKPTDLGATLGTKVGSASYGNSINSRGQVVGGIYGIGTVRAALWDGTTATDLGDDNYGTSANGINTAGTAVGSVVVDGWPHAVAWNGTTRRNLGELGGGFESGEAYAINDSDVVVGSEYSQFAEHAVMWDGPTVTDLNVFLTPDEISAGWVLMRAVAISNDGRIVGYANNPRLAAGFELIPQHLVDRAAPKP